MSGGDPGLAVLHSTTLPGRAWTRGNIGEAVPGLFTPLAWSVTGPVVDLGVRGGFRSIGVLSRREVFSSADPDRNVAAVFYGYAASNLTVFRGFADRMPGVSANSIEQQLLGTVRADARDQPTRRHYVRIILKMPLGVALTPGRLRRAHRDGHRWWTDQIGSLPDADLAEALAVLAEAERRFAHVMALHTVTSMLASAVYEQLEDLAGSVGRRADIADLVTGYGTMEETRIAALLWEVAHHRLALTDFLAEFGFHGPSTGQLASRVWREDHLPLKHLLDRFAGMPEDASPASREHRQKGIRQNRERALLGLLPHHRRLTARLLLRLAAVFVPGRERGKAGWLQVLDVARAACRRIGAVHARDGRIRHPDDVFFLVRSELETPGPDITTRIAERRAAHARCERARVPFWWTGNLSPEDVEPVASGRPAVLRGLGAYGGTVTGRAVVAEDPSDIDLEPDEVLVCHTTDPAWVPHFLAAAAVVIDVGGALSHGVIAARELGVVCVVGTGIATQVIRTGDQITVDGAGGLVTIDHDRGAGCPPTPTPTP